MAGQNLVTRKGTFYVLTSYNGPWQAAEKNDCNWYIVNTLTKASKKIGPVGKRGGTNNCDKAREEAERRNAKGEEYFQRGE